MDRPIDPRGPTFTTGTTTAADGTYRLTDLAAGTYLLEFSYLGYLPLTRRVELKPGRNQLDVQLEVRSFSTAELIVTATLADELTPVTYVEIDREEIAKNNLGQDVPYLLKWTPSAVVNSDAGTGIGYTGIWIRGSDPTRTNVTLNGIPLNDSESQGVFWVNLPDFAASADEVQVQRGVGTSTNGAGAFGASINFTTNQVKEDAYARLDGAVGSFGTRRATAAFGTGLINDRFTVDGRLSRITSDGYIDRATADLRSWYAGAAYVGDRSVLRLTAFGGAEQTYQAWNGTDPSLLADPATRTSNSAGTEKEGEPYDNEVDNYGQTHLQLHYSRELSAGWRVQLAGHYTAGAGYFEQYKAGQSLENYGITPPTIGDTTIAESDLIRRRWLDNDFYGTVYSLHYNDPYDRLRFTLGGAFNIYEGRHFGEVIWARFAGDSEIRENYYDNDARKTDFNTYARANYAFTSGLSAYLDLQVRRVNYEFLGLDNDLRRVNAEETLTFFNPKAGLLYELDPRSQVYLSVGVAQREPNRNDFVDNPAATRPRPEKLYNAELGYRRATDRLTYSANAYYMYYRDQLALTGRLNDVGEYIRTNIPVSYRLGLELQAAAQLITRLSTGAGLSLSRNRARNYTEFLDDYDGDFNYLGQVAVDRNDTPLAFSPDLTAQAEITYTQPLGLGSHFIETNLRTKYVGRRFLDNSGDFANAISGYTYTDLRIRYGWRPAFAEEIGFTLMVRNLFDALYSSNGWSYRYNFAGDTTVQQGFYPQAGINFLVGLNLRF